MKPLTHLDDMSKFQAVALYHRSEERTIKKAAHDVLAMMILAHAEECGWKIHAYMDLDSKRTSNRPLFDLMMKHARERRFQLILCFDLDFLFPGTASETLDIINKLTKWRIRYCSMMTLLYPVVDTIVQRLTVTELYDLIAKDDCESDPKYSNELVAIRLAERERHSARAKRHQGKNSGRPAVKKDEIMALLDAGKSKEEIIATGKASLATFYRTEKSWLKLRVPPKREIAIA